MPVFDFNSVPDEEKKNAVCTYETFMSNEESATPEKPILVIDNKNIQWCHHSYGMFTNTIKRTTFEFNEDEGVEVSDIFKVDARVVILLKWLGESHINVRLSGENTEDGYSVYKISEVAHGNTSKLSAEDGFLQYMIERLFASDAPAKISDDEEDDESGDGMKLTSLQSITDFINCAGATLPDNIRLWARRNLAVAKSHEVSPEERRHAQRALSIMMNIKWKSNYDYYFILPRACSIFLFSVFSFNRLIATLAAVQAAKDSAKPAQADRSSIGNQSNRMTKMTMVKAR